MTQDCVSYSRRTFMFFAAGATAALIVKPDESSAAIDNLKTLALHTKWSGERFIGPYAEKNRYLPEALAQIDHLYRDRHNEKECDIDVRLLDLLHGLKQQTRYRGSIEIVCGYRSKETNRALLKSGQRVAKDSLHIQGQAMDVRFYGLDLAKARQVALDMRAGGVGYYRRQKFLHLDVGPVRSW